MEGARYALDLYFSDKDVNYCWAHNNEKLEKMGKTYNCSELEFVWKDWRPCCSCKDFCWVVQLRKSMNGIYYLVYMPACGKGCGDFPKLKDHF